MSGVHSKEELTEALEEYKTEDVFILGGESIYRRFYEQCDKLYVTKMHANLNADRFMVNLDEDARFRVTWESELQNENGIEYQFVLYERKLRMAGKKKNGKNRRECPRGVSERREARGKSSYGGNRSNERSDGSRRGGRMAVGRTIPVRYMITAVREAGRAAAVHRGRRDSGAEIRSAEA